MKGWWGKCQSFNKGLPWSLGLISRFGNLGIKPTVEVCIVPHFKLSDSASGWVLSRTSLLIRGWAQVCLVCAPRWKDSSSGGGGDSLHLYGMKGLGPLYEHVSSLCLEHACYHPTGPGKWGLAKPDKGRPSTPISLRPKASLGTSSISMG